MKLVKGSVVKDIVGESLIADYIQAGWKEYVEPKEEKPKKYSDKRREE